MTPEDQSRSEFEAWYVQRQRSRGYGVHLTDAEFLKRMPDGRRYMSLGLDDAFQAWQEASRRTERATIQADELDARYGFVTKVARGMALEEAKRACEGEFLHEPQAGTEDIAYDYAVRDCIAAIAALAVETKEG